METRISSVETRLGERIGALEKTMETRIDALDKTIRVHDAHINRHMSTLKWGMGGLGGISAFFAYQISENTKGVAKLDGKLGSSSTHPKR